MNRYSLLFLATFLRALHTIAAPWAHEHDNLPVDSNVHFGQLANGFGYASFEKRGSKGECSVRLHVDVGSIQEEDGEQGMAHFLEHMAFRGGARFGPGEMIKTMQGLGLSFGPHLNAHTTYSETVYKFDLATCNKDSLIQILLALRDIADGLSIREEDVQAEKGPIDAEERNAHDFSSQQSEDLARAFQGSRIGDRLPLGYKSVRDHFTANSLRRFYEKWYQPGAMKLIVVGDLSGLNASIESAVTSIFTDMKQRSENEAAPSKPEALKRLTSVFESPDFTESRITSMRLQSSPLCAQDYTARGRHLKLYFLSILLHIRLESNLEASGAQQVALLMLDQCTSIPAFGLEFCESPRPAFGIGYTLAADHTRIKAAFEYYERLMAEIARNGFSDDEFNSLMTQIKRAIEGKTSRSFVEMVAELLNDARGLRGVADFAFSKQAAWHTLSEFTKEDAREMLATIWNQTPVIMSLGGQGLPSEAEVDQIVLEAQNEPSLGQTSTSRDLMSDQPYIYAAKNNGVGRPVFAASIIQSNAQIQQLNFANGVEVEIFQIDGYKNGEFEVRAALEQTADLKSRQDSVTDFIARSLFNYLGIGPHTQKTLEKLFKSEYQRTSFGKYKGHFRIDNVPYSSQPRELSTQFELIAGYLRSPIIDETSMRRFRDSYRYNYLSQSRGFRDFLCAVHESQSDLESCPPTPDEMDAVPTVDVSGYLMRLLQTEPLKVTIAGNEAVDDVAMAAATTFGTLPARSNAVACDSCTTSDFYTVLSSMNNQSSPLWNFTKGCEIPSLAFTVPAEGLCVAPRTRFVSGVKMEFQYPFIQNGNLMVLFPVKEKNSDVIRILATLAQDRLLQHIRYTLGSSYSISVSPKYLSDSLHFGEIEVQMDVDPKDVSFLSDQVFVVCETMAKEGVTQEELDRARAQHPSLSAFAKNLTPTQMQKAASEVFRRELASYASITPKRD